MTTKIKDVIIYPFEKIVENSGFEYTETDKAVNIAALESLVKGTEG